MSKQTDSSATCPDRGQQCCPGREEKWTVSPIKITTCPLAGRAVCRQSSSRRQVGFAKSLSARPEYSKPRRTDARSAVCSVRSGRLMMMMMVWGWEKESGDKNAILQLKVVRGGEGNCIPPTSIILCTTCSDSVPLVLSARRAAILMGGGRGFCFPVLRCFKSFCAAGAHYTVCGQTRSTCIYFCFFSLLLGSCTAEHTSAVQFVRVHSPPPPPLQL